MCSENHNFYPYIEGCETKRTNISGSSGIDTILLAWHKDIAKRSKAVLSRMRYAVIERMNASIDRSQIESLIDEYESALHEEYDGDWYDKYIDMIIMAGLVRSATLLESKRTEIKEVFPKDLIKEKGHINDSTIKYHELAIQKAVADLRNAMNEDYERSIVEEDFNFKPYETIENTHKKDIENSYNATAEVSGVGMLNQTMITAFVINEVTHFKILTNDPCPVCERLAQGDYTVEQVFEYDHTIEAMEDVTGRPQNSAKRYYAENPYIGMIPVHVNCRCSWSIL